MATVFYTDLGQLTAQSSKVGPPPVPSSTHGTPVSIVAPNDVKVDLIPAVVPGIGTEPYYKIPLWYP